MPKRSQPPGMVDVNDRLLACKTESGRKPASKKAKIVKSAPPRRGKANDKDKPTPEKLPANKLERKRIKVGVDFGTTNSGIAHVMYPNTDARDVEVIDNWPDGLRGNDRLEKVPSRIAFAFENANLDEDKWGYEVPANARSYSWTKLLLDTSAEKTRFDHDGPANRLTEGLLEVPEDMTPLEVITKYLSYLYQHTMGLLARRYSADVVEVTPIDFWFTHPATWQESSKADTREAAKAAGFGSRDGDKISLISEPEAAAIAVLSQEVEKNPGLIKIQNNVLMCDLGGGTLDFQVLTITKLLPQLQVDETIRGIGGKSGSTYIDRNFHNWMTVRFGDAFTTLPKEKIGVGSAFMKEWEVVKHLFNGRDLKKTFRVPFTPLGKRLMANGSTSDWYDSDDFTVLIPGAELRDMFETVVKKAFALMDELSEDLANERLPGFQMMCLVGGLGTSEYIWRRFQDYNKEKLGGKCQVFTDTRAWSAVVRGAAIRGLNGSCVLSKRAKRAYGIGVHKAFREGVDAEADCLMCPSKGKRAKGYLEFPIQMGFKFTENMRVKTDLYVTVPPDADEEDLIFQWKLFSCGLLKLPEKEKQGGKHLRPEGLINVDLRKWHQKIKIESQDGEVDIEDVPVSIVFKMGSEGGTLKVEALCERKVIGSAEIEYAHSHARKIKPQSAGLRDG